MSDEKLKKIFTRAIEEADKLKKEKKGQDISCGKVVCSPKKNKKQ